MKEPIFKATHIVKQFGPTIALNDVDIAIYPGEIRGFIGENGSGKSTMSAIMTGIYEATSGYMEYHGKEWKPASMVDALAGGIGIIVQENGNDRKHLGRRKHLPRRAQQLLRRTFLRRQEGGELLSAF